MIAAVHVERVARGGGRIRVGCSGWNYGSWRERFYPPRTPTSKWLARYAAAFDTVEVNATFYRLAREAAVGRWAEETPDGFCFAVKASRYLTHMKRLTDLDRGIDRFYAPLAPLVEAGKLGPVLWQLPADFQRDDDRLVGLLEALAVRGPGRHAFEPRHPSWWCDAVHRLLRAHGAALVVADRKGTQRAEGPVADWTYVRLHYGWRGRRGNYSAAEIAEWAGRLAAWQAHGDVYAYFNNDWEAFAPRNALALRRALADSASMARCAPGSSSPSA